MRTITIDDEAYKLLAKLKQHGDSFTKVIKRHIRVPADTCGELLDRLESGPRPDVDEEMFEVLEKGKGRRSPRRL